ncbi:MAG TPA: Jag N-terminal domain-containing protein [Candidatus Dependentiae bacterium]|nr:Jag N-terminal domain-containing protein [Candidatus Dependentiae bacterium]
MKSIIEEASSISKAIENGWIRAGKPQEFSVRVFEEPEKNFLGFTKKPAKIGIFYKETPVIQPRDGKRQQPRQALQQKSTYEKTQHIVKSQDKKQTQPYQTQSFQQQVQVKQQEGQKLPKWTPELIEGSRQWLGVMLKTIGQSNASFSTDARHYFLTIRFDGPVLQDKKKEQQLFKNWAHLLLQALRHKSKRGLRGYKVIITRAA